MAIVIQVRRGSAAEWVAAGTVLAAGEWGLETDTGKLKIGDGSSAWSDLPYLPGDPADITVNGQEGPDIVLGAADIGAATPADVSTAVAGVTLESLGGVADNDARLTDARTPTPHATSHGSGGADPISPASIDAVALDAVGAAGGVAALDGGGLVPRAQLPRMSKVVYDWRRETTDAISGVQYWQTEGVAVGDLIPHTLSLNADSIRINSSAANTTGNRREAWILGDDDYDNFEILVRIDEPSNIGVNMTPQPGLMLRGTGVGEETGKAIALFVNVFASYGPLNVYNFRPWALQPDGSMNDTGASSAGTVAMPKLSVPVKSASVASGNIFLATAIKDYANNSSFVTKATGKKLDFDVSSATAITNGITGVVSKTASSFGVIMLDSGGQADKPLGITQDVFLKYSDISTSNGTPIVPNALFPAWLKVRLVGLTFMAKWWHSYMDEPSGWVTIQLSSDAPLSGKIGLVSNHLYGADNYIAYGPIEITRLTNAQPPS